MRERGEQARGGETQQSTWQADLSTYEVPPARAYDVTQLMPGGNPRRVHGMEAPLLKRTETMAPRSVTTYIVRAGDE